MRIKEILRQDRRDFVAIYECEHCGHTCTSQGYDDTHFHVNVVPAMLCPECGKNAPENYRPLATRYPDSQEV